MGKTDVWDFTLILALYLVGKNETSTTTLNSSRFFKWLICFLNSYKSVLLIFIERADKKYLSNKI